MDESNPIPDDIDEVLERMLNQVPPEDPISFGDELGDAAFRTPRLSASSLFSAPTTPPNPNPQPTLTLPQTPVPRHAPPPPPVGHNPQPTLTLPTTPVPRQAPPPPPPAGQRQQEPPVGLGLTYPTYTASPGRPPSPSDVLASNYVPSMSPPAAAASQSPAWGPAPSGLTPNRNWSPQWTTDLALTTNAAGLSSQPPAPEETYPSLPTTPSQFLPNAGLLASRVTAPGPPQPQVQLPISTQPLAPALDPALAFDPAAFDPATFDPAPLDLDSFDPDFNLDPAFDPAFALPPAAPAGANDGQGRMVPARISHRRERKNSPSNNPAMFYTPLAARPTSWGGPRADNKSTFRYTDKGELETGRKYSTDEILQYVTQRSSRKDGRRLIIWIQNPPAQFNHRYPCGSASGICRWDRCPVKNNSILKGHWRVAFDEHGDELGHRHDPFHNAGYMHLYCLEKAISLIEMFLDPLVDIRPDMRPMAREERNPMALTRDHQGLRGVLEKWVDEQGKLYMARQAGRAPPAAQNDEDDDDRFLYRRLTRAHIELEGQSRSRARARRVHAGDTIENYLGDLGRFAKIKEDQATKRKQLQPSSIPPPPQAPPEPEWRPLPPPQPLTLSLPQPPPPRSPARKRTQAEAGLAGEQPAAKASRITPPTPTGQQNEQDWDLPQQQVDPDLQDVLRRDGPMTRRQGRAVDDALDRLASGATDRLVQLVRALPSWKQRVVQRIAMKDDRKVASF